MRLIDADYLKNLPFEKMIHTDWGDTAIPVEEIDNAPTISRTLSIDIISDEDIEKFKKIWQETIDNASIIANIKATWIYKDYGYNCSICNNRALELEDYPYLSRYCPFCGAEMEIEN